MTHGSRRGQYGRWILGVVGLGCLAALIFWCCVPSHQPSAKTFDSDSTDLHQTVIVPTLDTPFPENKSAIWCGSFVLAWKRLQADVAGRPIGIRNAEAIAERLNRAEFSEADLAPETVYAAAGLNKDGIREKIRADMAKKFPGVALPDMHAHPDGAMAFAHLKAEVTFQEPYLVNPDRFTFTDGQGRETAVSSFGIPKSNRDVPQRLREQIEVLYLAQDESRRQVTEFALDLCKYSRPHQIVLARIPRKETLADTLAYLQDKMTAFRSALPANALRRESAFDFNDRLLIPSLHYRITHHFRALEGEDKLLLHPDWHNVYLETAFQSIEFRLDPQGAAVASSALVEVKSREPRIYHFNRPFLLFLKKRDTKYPFFVMWIENAELAGNEAREK